MTDLQPLTPEEGVERFLDHRRPSVAESTMRNAETRLRFFVEWCESRDVDNLNDLSGRDLADFVAWRRPDVAAITLQKQLSTVRTALRYWADIEGVTEGLAEKVHAPELPDGAESRDVVLDESRADLILEHLNRYEYASKKHTTLAILWRTGMRRSALRALDVGDLRPEDDALVLRNRPETGTRLKNGDAGERWVYLGPRWYQIVEDYVATNRDDVTDEYGRSPLMTTRYGRAHAQTLQKWVYEVTRPCIMHECPHDTVPRECDAALRGDAASKCPSSRSPHAIRRGAITSHLLDEVPPEVVSERMDVSLEVLYRHYDARTQGEKMNQRRRFL